MIIDKDDVQALMGLDDMVPGFARRYVLDGSGRRAMVSWDHEGRLVADVTEEVDGEDAAAVVTLSGRYLDEDDAFDVEGRDGSGECGDASDPRGAAAAWRRLVRPMRTTG